ncbi:MAG: excinuclease ABC subunit C [Ignavibacteria bacterium]|jgi:excinuclease ABC subunit C|nr:excinuclease ABC subunit C [Ignavibacteria bacterium]
MQQDEQNISEALLEKLSHLPTRPGIYQYMDNLGKIIYIGKAKNLKNRVMSYFQTGRIRDAKTTALIKKICDVEVIIVDSEAEAFILEDTLIKKHKPRYNIMLRDDKTYPFIRITNEEFPKIFFTRNVVRDGSKYLGPYTDLKKVKFLLHNIRNIFQIRSCNLKLTSENIAKGKFRSCLDYHIGKCQAPCINLISQAEYLENISMATQVLFGKTKLLTSQLEKKMLEYSDELKYEKAEEIKQRIIAIKDFSAKQKIVSTDLADRDVFGIAQRAKSACTLIFNIREGKLISKRHFIITNTNFASDEEILQRTIEKLYLESDFIPKELLLPTQIDQMEYITDWLSKKKQRVISVQIPQIGDKKKLVEMANTNAEFILSNYLLSLDKREQKIPHSVVALQRDLRLKSPPRRIECYDNSHIQGSELVSSMVVFVDGKPKKSEYRKFKAKEVQQNDDFAMMRETISRRFRRALEEEQILPDLVIVDGGKGQLSSAYSVLKELDLAEKIAIIGIAKRLEEIFLPNISDSILLPKTSSSLKLIQQLRDEAHRFAITFHRQLRDKRTISSELDDIKGVGEVTKRKLLTEFGSVKEIKLASDSDLLKIVTLKQLKAIKEKLHSHSDE